MSKEQFESEKPRIKRIDRIEGMIIGGLCEIEINYIIAESPELTKNDKRVLRSFLFVGEYEHRVIPFDWGVRTGFELPKLSIYDHDKDVAEVYEGVE
jgi:hypothetical protein